jgi:hypothetical protein
MNQLLNFIICDTCKTRLAHQISTDRLIPEPGIVQIFDRRGWLDMLCPRAGCGTITSWRISRRPSDREEATAVAAELTQHRVAQHTDPPVKLPRQIAPSSAPRRRLLGRAQTPLLRLLLAPLRTLPRAPRGRPAASYGR